MVSITPDPIDVQALRRGIAASGHGAIVLFEGVARDHHLGKAVRHLDYEAFEPMALAEMGKIVEEIRDKWPATNVFIVHRVGRVEIGEAAVVIAVASPHRAEAYEANRYAIEELKARVPVWKKETYSDGTAWIGNRS